MLGASRRQIALAELSGRDGARPGGPSRNVCLDLTEVTTAAYQQCVDEGECRAGGSFATREPDGVRVDTRAYGGAIGPMTGFRCGTDAAPSARRALALDPAAE